LVGLAVRSPAGRLSDRLGRRAVIAPALAISSASLVVLGLTESQAMFLLAAALYGVGFGAGQPALLAMTADRVPPGERGRAMGTLYTAWKLGISGGAILLGLCAPRLGYAVTWWTAAALAAAGALAALFPGARLRG
jgi:MFS family permease